MKAEGEDDLLAAALFEERPSRVPDAAILARVTVLFLLCSFCYMFGFRSRYGQWGCRKLGDGVSITRMYMGLIQRSNHIHLCELYKLQTCAAGC